MSITRSRPYENAIAFGGVAAGNMNAYEAAIPAGNNKYSMFT